jgi:hypothetical protein
MDDRTRYDPTDRVLEEDGEDGSTTFHFGADDPEGPFESDHYENLAEILDETALSDIAGELIRGIEDDQRSRQEWLSQRVKGIDILALKLEPPRSDLGSSAAPMEGMSNVRHPLLLEACLRSHATLCGELLPPQGPLKVDNEGQQTDQTDDQADRLEKDLNVFLTSTSTEYMPDSKRMMWGVVWSGAGFKKGYHCPIRRRPVLESIDAEKLIISNNATDIQSASRVTHVIDMDTSTFIRMKIAGAYRDIELAAPEEYLDPVTKKIARLQGIDKTGVDLDDMDRTIYECYADLDIPGYEHKHKGKITGLPVPYKVSIDKSSRKILEIRRNWKEDDKDCLKKKTFVMYGFVPMFGFYPSGLLHILGNTAVALTAAWRIALDSGMFGNFPGFLLSDTGADQDNNQLRCAPGSGVKVNVPAGQKIADSYMPLPYKSVDAAFLQLIDNVSATGQRVGGTADMPVAAGKQDAPVGTTLALIEQAAKVMSEVHVGICQSQAEEFAILKELLQEDPEALWRHRKNKQVPWDVDTLIAALQNYDLIPRADPNTPSHMHRMARAEAFAQKVAMTPDMFDLRKCYMYYFRAIGMNDVEQFFALPQPPKPDPKHAADAHTAEMKAQSDIHSAELKARSEAQTNQIKLMDIQARQAEGAANRASKEKIEQLRIAERLATHPLSQEIVTGGQPQ